MLSYSHKQANYFVASLKDNPEIRITAAGYMLTYGNPCNCEGFFFYPESFSGEFYPEGAPAVAGEGRCVDPVVMQVILLK